MISVYGLNSVIKLLLNRVFVLESRATETAGMGVVRKIADFSGAPADLVLTRALGNCRSQKQSIRGTSNVERKINQLVGCR